MRVRAYEPGVCVCFAAQMYHGIRGANGMRTHIIVKLLAEYSGISTAVSVRWRRHRWQRVGVVAVVVAAKHDKCKMNISPGISMRARAHGIAEIPGMCIWHRITHVIWVYQWRLTQSTIWKVSHVQWWAENYRNALIFETNCT